MLIKKHLIHTILFSNGFHFFIVSNYFQMKNRRQKGSSLQSKDYLILLDSESKEIL